MWVWPDETGLDPGYEQLEIGDELLRGGLVPVASGRPGSGGEAAVRIRQRDATLHAARLAPGATVPLPAAPYVHLYVPQGTVTLEGAGAEPLAEGAAARIAGSEGPRVTAGGSGAEILVWEMHSGIR
jgi:hypothetical protein